MINEIWNIFRITFNLSDDVEDYHMMDHFFKFDIEEFREKMSYPYFESVDKFITFSKDHLKMSILYSLTEENHSNTFDDYLKQIFHYFKYVNYQ